MSAFARRLLAAVCSRVHNTAFYLPVADTEDENSKLVSLLPQMHHFKVKRLCIMLKEQRHKTFFSLFFLNAVNTDNKKEGDLRRSEVTLFPL